MSPWTSDKRSQRFVILWNMDKMRETRLIIIHKSFLILYFWWNIWVLVWLSAGFALFGYYSTRSVGPFLWEACLFQPWLRHGQQRFRRLCSQRSSWKLRLRRFKNLEVKDPREPISEPWWDDDTTLVAMFLGRIFFFRRQGGLIKDVNESTSSQEAESSKGWFSAVLHQLLQCFFRFAIQIFNRQSLSFDGFLVYKHDGQSPSALADCERKSSC